MAKRKHIVVLINGKRRSGKGLLSSALAEKLRKRFDDNIHILSFAEPIKKITEPILEEIKWDGKDKEVVRPLWIAMGEVGRNVDNNIWCTRVFNKIRDIIKKSIEDKKNTLILIDDLRFPNELDYFKKEMKEIQESQNKDKDVSKVIAIRIEKFMDANKFVLGVDDNSTETSFDKLVNICFDHIVPQNTMINEEWVADFKGVDISANTIIENFFK
ncbi:phosphomevalonate kinase [Mycoplasmopsis mustelae]|uniref:Phosphomevalonate kinase n=1 Tax=Mycoplasmopsis mustelae TaxID=171289 RepID=A0A4R7UCC8_9BACT|nr:hypothetical protein [Mycoplasmopsis mustelae]TDV24068.1 phosphomevalonate kinase [Mycoplasmopsis mustelae]